MSEPCATTVAPVNRETLSFFIGVLAPLLVKIAELLHTKPMTFGVQYSYVFAISVGTMAGAGRYNSSVPSHLQIFTKRELIMSANSLDQALAHTVGTIPECVAAGYVDIASGMLLSMKTVDSHPGEVIDLLAAATADLFAGPNIVTIENLFKKARGVALDNHHYFQEIMVNSDNLIHIFPSWQTAYRLHCSVRLSENGESGYGPDKIGAALPSLESAV